MHWYLDTETNTFLPQQNKTRCFEYLALSYLQQLRPDCKNESLYTAGKHKS